MNFFQHQEKARQQTVKLVLLFAIAVIVVCLLTATAVALIYGHFFVGPTTAPASASKLVHFVSHPAFYWSALIAASIILIGSVFKTLQLGGNGIQVALAMDGKYVHPETRDEHERRLLNIVAEMALASGNPVPRVFKLPGDGINAFAAGHNRHQIVVAVTEGALSQLSRDELQGVIAHEFSHINFGDVKINMRLVALLHGILLIGHIGHLLADSRGSSYRHRHHRRNSKSASVGFAFIAIGFIGTVCGNMIKAAISRQREFLADAAAVQFTRNPDGIAGALKKIAGQSDALQSASAKGAQFSHFYFSNVSGQFINRLFATHPAIDERITRLGHRLDFTPTAQTATANQAHTMGFTGTTPPAPANPTSANNALDAEALVQSVGNPSAANLDAASQQLNALPASLEKATHDAFSAQALVYAMIIHFTESEFHSAQLASIRHEAGEQLSTTTAALLKSLDGVSFNQCHNLVLMAETPLQDQSPAQAATFKNLAQTLIQADRQFSLFEWCLYRLAVSPFEVGDHGRLSIKECQEALSLLFFYVASFCAPDHRRQLLSDVSSILKCPLQQPKQISLKRLDKAIQKLAQLKPLSKPLLLKALVAAIQVDRQVTEKEIALLRMVALILDCPVPAISTN